MKISIAHLKEIFHSPLQVTIFKQQDVQPKLEVISVKHVEPITEIEPKQPADPVKENFSTFFIQTQIARYTQNNHSSSVILKMGFCCDKPNSKLLITNHVATLLDCRKDNCQGHIVKVPLEAN
jgi:hypothetical protein